MLYFKCPTCGTVLAHRELPFEQGTKKICDDPDLSKEEMDKKISELINSLGLTRQCCRMRLLTYIDLITIIK